VDRVAFAAVLAHARQTGDDVLIAYDAENSITLLDVRLSDLRAGDFIFA
jgi:hypothetical protein